MTIHQLEHQETINESPQKSIVVISDQVRTPENVGMIFRVAESFGVEKLLFCGDSPDLTNKKVKRTTRNTEKEVSFEFNLNANSVISSLRKDGFQLVGLELTNHSTDIRQTSFTEYDKIAIFIGSERQGISLEILEKLDSCVYIPMWGKNSSINVVNALSIALYEIINQMDS